jgi:tetratricopeptide (TPR) repeat protein
MTKLEALLEKIEHEIPRKENRECVLYIGKKFGVPEPSDSCSDLRLFGRTESTWYDVARLGRLVYMADTSEEILKTNSDNQEYADTIRFYLARKVYPEVIKKFHSCADNWQFGWLHYHQNITHELFQFSEKSRARLNKLKKEIKSKAILKRVLYEEAEEFDEENKTKLELIDKNPAWGSPSNRGVLANAADKWALAGEMEKASEYYERAGPWEYARAASMFENLKDSERAKKFWILRAKNPTGYSDAIHYEAGRCWEKVGNIPEAIKSFERAIEVYEWQDGSYDLHGDPKPGSEAADSLRERVAELKELLAKGKPLERNPRKERLEGMFNFPVVLEGGKK